MTNWFYCLRYHLITSHASNSQTSHLIWTPASSNKSFKLEIYIEKSSLFWVQRFPVMEKQPLEKFTKVVPLFCTLYLRLYPGCYLWFFFFFKYIHYWQLVIFLSTCEVFWNWLNSLCPALAQVRNLQSFEGYKRTITFFVSSGLNTKTVAVKTLQPIFTILGPQPSQYNCCYWLGRCIFNRSKRFYATNSVS